MTLRRQGVVGHAGGKDAGSARSRATGATEDAASRRPVRPGGQGFVWKRARKLLDAALSGPPGFHPPSDITAVGLARFEVCGRGHELELQGIQHLKAHGAQLSVDQFGAAAPPAV